MQRKLSTKLNTHLWLKNKQTNKNLQKIGIQGTYHSIIKTIFETPTANISLNGSVLFDRLTRIPFWEKDDFTETSMMRSHLFKLQRKDVDEYEDQAICTLWSACVFHSRGFPGSSAVKESTCSVWDPSLIPGLERSPGEEIGYPLQYSWASLVAQMVKNLPAMWETLVWSLGWEDPLEEGMETHSGVLAGESPWTEDPGGLQSMGSQRVGHDWVTKHSTHNPWKRQRIGEGLDRRSWRLSEALAKSLDLILSVTRS